MSSNSCLRCHACTGAFIQMSTGLRYEGKKQNRNINNQGFHKTCHGCFFFDGLGTVWTHLNLESTPTQVGTNLSNNNFTTNKCSSCTPLEPRFFPRCAPGKTFIIEQYVPTNFMETLHTGHCHIFSLPTTYRKTNRFEPCLPKLLGCEFNDVWCSINFDETLTFQMWRTHTTAAQINIIFFVGFVI